MAPPAPRRALWRPDIVGSCGTAEHKKAVVAVAHALLVTAYHLLAHQTTYHELGPDYFDGRHTERVTRRAVQALEQQGYRVTLERIA